MAEPIRGYMEVPGETIHSVRQIAAREDRATQVDIERVGFGLAKVKGEADAYEVDEPIVVRRTRP